MEPHRKDARTRWRRHAATACGLALVFAIGAWLGRASVRDEDMPAAVDPVAAGVSAMTRSPPASPATPRPTTPFPALPAEDVPIAAVHDELVARARRGDAAAAMRLAVDLRRCHAWQDERPEEDEVSDPVRAQHLAVVSARCDGLAPGATDEADDWLLRAAELGDTGAMVCYAWAPGDYALPVLSERWIAWARRWRETALSFAVRAYEAGDASALLVLAQAYAPRTQGLPIDAIGSLVEPDPVRAAVYVAMSKKLRANDRGSAAPSEWSGLDARQADAARRLFQRDWPRFAQAGDPFELFKRCPHTRRGP
ncbi:hypothetical protein ACQQ2N_06980 [Dokdonella sp. MW10]|uniref:hypothetical protein n=1 Tax=Dokdonella sp. MW10 TaxID=2992926 RepID=UPI003F7D0BA2